jgi:hypothetical protein
VNRFAAHHSLTDHIALLRAAHLADLADQEERVRAALHDPPIAARRKDLAAIANELSRAGFEDLAKALRNIIRVDLTPSYGAFDPRYRDRSCE